MQAEQVRRTASQLPGLEQVVWPIEWLTCYRLGTSPLAGTNHDQKLHETVIDPVTAALHDENILATDGCADIDWSLSIAKLLELAFRGAGWEPLTDRFNERGMRRSRKDLYASHTWTDMHCICAGKTCWMLTNVEWVKWWGSRWGSRWGNGMR